MAKSLRRKKKGKSGGKKKWKVHHPWKPRTSGRNECSPWVQLAVHDTVIEVPGVPLCAKLVHLLRLKHTTTLTWFRASDFLGDVRRYIPLARLVQAGQDVPNTPSFKIADEEAWLF